MESRRDSMLCSADEDDFLSRYVNLEWDADGSDYRDEFPDILSSEIFSREHSHEKIYEEVKNSRKSSLEKPVGFLMQLKPRAYVCENLKSSLWGKFFSSERKNCDSSQAYLKENTDCNTKINIEKNDDQKSGRQSQCQSVASGCKRSKSVNDVLKDSTKVGQKQEQKQSLKQERKEENTCGMKRAANLLSKQFSVYSQNFELNTRFLSKTHYHISHWKPEKSRVKTKENLTNKKDPNLDVVIEKRIALKKDDEKATEVEEIRRKFNTDKYYRSWVWEPKDCPSNKLKIFGKADQNLQNSSTKSSKMYSSTEFASRKTKSQRKSTEERKKVAGQFRQHLEGNTGPSTVSLPAISNQNISSVIRKKSPHKLGHFPCITKDNLVTQYKKYHDEFIKQKNTNNKKINQI